MFSSHWQRLSRCTYTILTQTSLTQTSLTQTSIAAAEVHDVVLPGMLRRVQPKVLGLFQRFVVGPVIVRNPVTGDYSAGAVFALPAVDEHRPLIGRVKDRHQIGYLSIGGREKAFHGNVDVA